jgi:hypothetical protein
VEKISIGTASKEAVTLQFARLSLKLSALVFLLQEAPGPLSPLDVSALRSAVQKLISVCVTLSKCDYARRPYTNPSESSKTYSPIGSQQGAKRRGRATKKAPVSGKG